MVSFSFVLYSSCIIFEETCSTNVGAGYIFQMSSLLWLQTSPWVVCRSVSQRTYTLHELQWCIIGKGNVILYFFFLERSLSCSRLNIPLYVSSISAWLEYVLKVNLGLPSCPSFRHTEICLYPAVYQRYGKFFLFDISSDYFSLTFYTCSNIQEMPAVGCDFYSFLFSRVHMVIFI